MKQQFKTWEEYLAFEESRKERSLNEDDLRKEYMEKIGEPIAMYCIMGNQIFREKFSNNQALVYEYCLEHQRCLPGDAGCTRPARSER